MNNLRPTKKQQELLVFIQQFTEKNGYSPTYREIMKGLSYTSVATVAAHVNRLIERGHLIKRERSARSIEVIDQTTTSESITPEIIPSGEKWLIDRIKAIFDQIEELEKIELSKIESLDILVEALKILNIDSVVPYYSEKLVELRNRL